VNATADEQLRDAGLRVTAQRRAVLEAVAGAEDHPTVDEVARRVRTTLGSVSTQAVYDVLDALHRVRLVRRLEPAGSPARYEGRVGDNHHHLVCRRCGLTVDVDCAVGSAPCLEPSDGAGFVLDEAEVTYWGTCPACTKKRKKESA
jgi:Fur family ferric uptake transcriptional regulator